MVEPEQRSRVLTPHITPITSIFDGDALLSLSETEQRALVLPDGWVLNKAEGGGRF